MLILVQFFNGSNVFGLSIFIPSIVNSLGFSPIKSQLLATGPFICAFFGKQRTVYSLATLTNNFCPDIVALPTSYLSDKFNCRSIPIILGSILSSIGFILYLCRRCTLSPLLPLSKLLPRLQPQQYSLWISLFNSIRHHLDRSSCNNMGC
jgi:hypothetical protein